MFWPILLYIEPLAESWSQVLPQVPTQFTNRLNARIKSLLAHQISARTKIREQILKSPSLVKHIKGFWVGSQLEIVKQYYASKNTRGSPRKMLSD